MALITVPLLLLFPLNPFPMSCQFMTIWNWSHSPLALVWCSEFPPHSLLIPSVSNNHLLPRRALWTPCHVIAHSEGTLDGLPGSSLRGKVQHIFFPVRKSCVPELLFLRIICNFFFHAFVAHLWLIGKHHTHYLILVVRDLPPLQ